MSLDIPHANDIIITFISDRHDNKWVNESDLLQLGLLRQWQHEVMHAVDVSSLC